MKDVLMKINDNYGTFSKKHKKLSDFILLNYEKVILMSISVLARESKVSEATIVRFVYKLGFDGYKEFQEGLLNSVKNNLTTIQRLNIGEDVDYDELILDFANNDINDISKTINHLDYEKIEKAIELVNKSKKIYILGMRSSHILANYLSYYMNLLAYDVVTVEGTIMEPFEQLIKIKENDVLISFAFPRYSKRAIQATKLASEKGAKIISITDSEDSPYKEFSTISLKVFSSMSSFIDSLVAPMAFINIFLLLLGKSQRENVKKDFELLESLWEKYETYIKL